MSAARITVCEEPSLTGIHCPGSVNITCDGIKLTALRWTYNDNIELKGYLSGDPVQSELLSEFPSFISVALLNVTQYTDPRFANFTSVLTANLHIKKFSLKKDICLESAR